MLKRVLEKVLGTAIIGTLSAALLTWRDVQVIKLRLAIIEQDVVRRPSPSNCEVDVGMQELVSKLQEGSIITITRDDGNYTLHRIGEDVIVICPDGKSRHLRQNPNPGE